MSILRILEKKGVVKIKDILFITHFTQVPGEKSNGRFPYIIDNLDNDSMSIEVVTTSFSHRTKQMRNISEEHVKSVDYKLTMIDEPGYRKNVTLQRFYSHYILGQNLKKYLKKRKKPDVIYCSVPSLDVARVAAKYTEQHNIRFIIDVQDL